MLFPLVCGHIPKLLGLSIWSECYKFDLEYGHLLREIKLILNLYKNSNNMDVCLIDRMLLCMESLLLTIPCIHLCCLWKFESAGSTLPSLPFTKRAGRACAAKFHLVMKLGINMNVMKEGHTIARSVQLPSDSPSILTNRSVSSASDMRISIFRIPNDGLLASTKGLPLFSTFLLIPDQCYVIRTLQVLLLGYS